MFGISKKVRSCPECGEHINVQYRGSHVRNDKCPSCGADLLFDVDGSKCRVSLGFQCSGMHGPLLKKGMIK